jgi:hypothetical protein
LSKEEDYRDELHRFLTEKPRKPPKKSKDLIWKTAIPDKEAERIEKLRRKIKAKETR